MSADERTGWRDEGLSRLHRTWGYDCPAFDLDFVLVEYETGTPRGFVEYKNEQCKTVCLSHPSYEALRKIAKKCGLPAFCTIYSTDYRIWWPKPLNTLAEYYVGSKTDLSQAEWVILLYRMRFQDAPLELLKEIAVMYPPRRTLRTASSFIASNGHDSSVDISLT